MPAVPDFFAVTKCYWVLPDSLLLLSDDNKTAHLDTIIPIIKFLFSVLTSGYSIDSPW